MPGDVLIQRAALHAFSEHPRNLPGTSFLSTGQIQFSRMDLSPASDAAVQDAAIFTLPMELLLRIFFLSFELDPPSQTKPRRASSAADLRPPTRARRNTLLITPLPSRLGWIRITHVCRYWRTAALSYPALWGTIPLALGGQWARTALERAQSSELVIHHTIYPGTAGSALLSQTDFLSNELSRIQTLELGGEPDSLGAVLKRLTKSAPRLQVLTIQADRSVGPQESWPLTLPRGLFGGSVPCLHSLTLDNCLLPSTHYDLRRLRHLSLCLLLPKRLHSSTLDTLAMLRNMAELETLTLKHCLQDELPSGETPLELPSLQRIELVDGQSAVASFLRLVTFPNNASLDVQCSMSSDSGDESSLALDVIIPCVIRVQQPRLVVFSSDGRGLHIEMPSAPNTRKPDLYMFFIHSGLGEWDYPRLVRQTFAAVQPSYVERIDLRLPEANTGTNGSWRSLPDLWTVACSRFKYVRSVHTSLTLGWAVCSALTEGRDTDSRLFPQLQTLVFTNVDFYAPMYLNNLFESMVPDMNNVTLAPGVTGVQSKEVITIDDGSDPEVEVVPNSDSSDEVQLLDANPDVKGTSNVEQRPQARPETAPPGLASLQVTVSSSRSGEVNKAKAGARGHGTSEEAQVPSAFRPYASPIQFGLSTSGSSIRSDSSPAREGSIATGPPSSASPTPTVDRPITQLDDGEPRRHHRPFRPDPIIPPPRHPHDARPSKGKERRSYSSTNNEQNEPALAPPPPSPPRAPDVTQAVLRTLQARMRAAGLFDPPQPTYAPIAPQTSGPKARDGDGRLPSGFRRAARKDSHTGNARVESDNVGSDGSDDAGSSSADSDVLPTSQGLSTQARRAALKRTSAQGRAPVSLATARGSSHPGAEPSVRIDTLEQLMAYMYLHGHGPRHNDLAGRYAEQEAEREARAKREGERLPRKMKSPKQLKDMRRWRPVQIVRGCLMED
ncbi:hypothetical protein K488DRAFT_82107 [Vararia minispora EC-137]|uniref:Uncharacterized protein n=1 Tax=Vararia minispora EC-137 TaxID=1314806 RepID=A0ACB8QY24_9AGAM|nr:hypothetical protein K488DRAFT_82107 [Vararia minispora EC-137]